MIYISKTVFYSIVHLNQGNLVWWIMNTSLLIRNRHGMDIAVFSHTNGRQLSCHGFEFQNNRNVWRGLKTQLNLVTYWSKINCSMFSIMKEGVCTRASLSLEWQPSSPGRPLRDLVAGVGDGYQVASVVTQRMQASSVCLFTIVQTSSWDTRYQRERRWISHFSSRIVPSALCKHC